MKKLNQNTSITNINLTIIKKYKNLAKITIKKT